MVISINKNAKSNLEEGEGREVLVLINDQMTKYGAHVSNQQCLVILFLY